MRKTKGPLLPLLIPTAPGEKGEPAEFSGAEVRELSLKEARDLLAQNPEQNLAVGKILEQVRLVAWNDRPALYLDDRTLAPYVRSFVRFKGERSLSRCPMCGKWFVQKRPDQVYDTVAHRERHRVIRWRAGTVRIDKKKSLVDTPLCASRYLYIKKYLLITLQRKQCHA